MKAKIGLLGGTFDPPHIAHLIIAQEALSSLQLDEVWFIPVYTPPHKTRQHIAEPSERLEMTNRAVAGNENFQVCTVELDRKGPSYTVDTVKALKNNNQHTSFYFIIGADMAEQLHTWKSIDQLKKSVTFVVAERPGYDAGTKTEKGIEHIEIPRMDVSSTTIRERSREGKSIRYFVSDSVRNFIEERNLYG